MFGIGGILITFFVSVLVLRPDDFPRIIKIFGFYFKKFKKFNSSFEKKKDYLIKEFEIKDFH